jgi:phosphotransferase system HPr (HPr) family protein
MRESEVKVINPLGLHARAAAQLVRLATTFSSRITLYRGDKSGSANAKSILSLLALAVSSGTIVRIEVEGQDEETAMGAVELLFATGFGEL